MKNTKYMKTIRILLVAALGGMLLGSCSRDDGFRDTPNGDAVSFTAGIVAATRTTGGGDAWVVGDKVGICMLTNGGDITVTADVLADNAQYNVTDATTGALSPDGTPIYYPMSGTVDFIAYYPHGTVTTEVYISVVGQTSESAQNALDVLYAKTTGVEKSANAVGLAFGHVLSKVTLDVKPGTGFVAADISGIEASAVAFGGMPAEASLALQDGALTAGTDLAQTFAPLKNATTPAGVDASFTALLVPQAANAYTGRTVTFTVGGQNYTWTIPDTEPFAAGSHYTYPVTVNKTGITVGDPEITDWTTSDKGTGTVKQVRIVPEANCYMVEPDDVPILIPVSQANKAADPQYNLEAETTGLGDVKPGNFTVELVWGDTPVEDGGVIEEIRADGEYVYVKPGIAGNAVVAIRDKTSGTIKWSWHIWVTEPVGSTTANGLTWMDRNLGAAGTTYDAGGKNGLFYQWGRKDAFPGSDGTTKNLNQTYYIGGSATATEEDPPTGEYTELPDMVQNPLNLATNSLSYLGSLNVPEDKNDSWGGVSGEKTLYDPCPPGWRVPKSGEWNDNNWTIATNGFTNDAYGGFYPLAGGRALQTDGSIKMYYVGRYGYYWQASGRKSLISFSYIMFIYYLSNDNYRISPNNVQSRVSGYSVRCRAE